MHLCRATSRAFSRIPGELGSSLFNTPEYAKEIGRPLDRILDAKLMEIIVEVHLRDLSEKDKESVQGVMADFLAAGHATENAEMEQLLRKSPETLREYVKGEAFALEKRLTIDLVLNRIKKIQR